MYATKKMWLSQVDTLDDRHGTPGMLTSIYWRAINYIIKEKLVILKLIGIIVVKVKKQG